MLSTELEYCLNDAFQRAREERHEFITVDGQVEEVIRMTVIVE